MATYKEIFGKQIKFLSSDPANEAEGQIWYNSTAGAFKSVVASEAWSSSAAMLNARNDGSGSDGIQTAAFYAGGGPGNLTVTEEYNGSGWSIGGALNTGRSQSIGFGSLTAGVAAGGYTTGNVDNVEEYNGAAWTAGTGLPTATRDSGAGGPQTAAFYAGGYDTGYTTTTVEYNGASWAGGGAMSNARRNTTGFGTLTAGAMVGGTVPPATTATEEYNGTAWATGGVLAAATSGNMCAGTQTSGLSFGGNNPSITGVTESYDGSTWATTGSLATGRTDGGRAGASSSSALCMGGSDGSALGTTEEFNKSASVITGAAWASAPALNNARKAMYSGNIGTPTSALAVGSSPASNLTEEYDGSSWTVQNVAPASLYGRGGAGTQIAALTFGGNPNPAVVTTTAEYDGVNWTVGGVLNTGRGYGPIGAGTQTAGMAIGGWNPALPTYPPGYVTTVEFYNGASWTNNPVAGPSIYGGAGSGTQAAAWVAGSASVSPTPANQQSYEWDGASWTAGGLYTMAAVANIFGGGPTTTAWVAAGDADPGLKVATSHYDGTAWSTAPNLSTARDNGGATGAQTTSLAIGGGTPPASTTVEEFSGDTSAANIVTLTTS